MHFTFFVLFAFIVHYYHYSFVPIIFVSLHFFLPTTGHGMVANGSVGLGSSVIDFPIAI